MFHKFNVIISFISYKNVTFQAKTSTQNFLPGKTPGFPREFTGTHRDLPGSLPGFTGTFTGIYRKVSWDMAFSSLDSLGNPGKCR